MAAMDMSDDIEEHSSEELSYSSSSKQKGKRIVQESFETVVPVHRNRKPLERSPKRLKVNRELFPHSEGAHIFALVPANKNLVRKVPIADIGNTKDRFAVEGKVLNVYGTYDTSLERFLSSKFLKTDLLDASGFSTVTVIFGSACYKKFWDIIVPETCLRVEGASVCARNPNDGGSIDFSLRVDVTTVVTQIPFFETRLLFVPELSIRAFLEKSSSIPNFKSTIAFVVVQVDNIAKSEGGVYDQLTVADGLLPMDRATLTFVNKRKSLYYRIVDDFNKGNIIPFLARNIGAWKDKSNTLSVLDITVVSPLHNSRKIKQLEEAFRAQIANLGYGKEVVGDLHISNFNGTLLVKKCEACKSQNLNLLADGGFCFPCGSKVAVVEIVRLLGEIQQLNATVEVTLTGEIVDKVLQFDTPLLVLIKEN